MGPDDVDLVRVYTRDTGAVVAQTSFAVAGGFQIVVEAVAGATIHGMGTQYQTGIVLRDLTAGNTIATVPAGFGPEGMDGAGANWPNQSVQFVYNVPAANLVGRAFDVCEVIAFLRAGIANPDAELATSPLILLTT